MRRLKFFSMFGVIALSSCGDSLPDRSEDGREAEGEVLGGSISDDMLPLDQLRSQSPVIREQSVTVSENDDGSTTVETTVTVTSGDGAENQPAPPQPPATPEG
ncbi:hypothetical protein [Altererythrobacter ishigakiensis]|uniref:Uncharacterized protein n=1 Tax=Altererythrobacter ishigakiensis TaxID=476157 RepID=A0A562UUL2_9SPHN|nr:hypothetical protein [Altererythrobacter ishigakiensis]TWJ09324.1 hypothetical protein JN10_0955 [Altererythrobacter ishigakiensis]